VIDEPTRRLDEGALPALVPRVFAGLAGQQIQGLTSSLTILD
jgi:hypothetical protein